MQSPITQLDALDLAAAALRDCRKAALAAAEPRYASLLFEAHDHIQHLREQYKGNAVIVPHETNGGANAGRETPNSDPYCRPAEPTLAPVFAPTLSH